MKTTIIIVALCITGYSLAATQGQPLKASFCNGNVDGATTCSACMNTQTAAMDFVSASGTCIAMTNKVVDCHTYISLKSANKSLADCIRCDSKDWLNIKDNAAPAQINMKCSNTADNTTTCDAKISNCAQSICYTNQSSAVSKHCRVCDNDYKGSGTLTNLVGYASCVAQTITNCKVGNPFDTTKCYQCDSGYAVVTAETSCKSFSTDSKCRLLDGTDAFCRACYDGYIFDLLKCVSSAKLVTVAAMAIALFFFN